MSVRRLCLLLATAFVVGQLLGTSVETVIAGLEDRTDLPDRFSVAPPRVGDRADYHALVVEQTPEGPVVRGTAEPALRIEWLLPRDLLDQVGQPHRVNELRVVAFEGQPDGEPRASVWLHDYDATTHALVATTELEDLEPLRAGDDPFDSRVTDGLTSVERSTQFAERAGAGFATVCGARHPLQGTPHVVGDPVVLFRPCSLHGILLGAPAFRAATPDVLGERETIRFDAVEAGRHLHAWFAPESPYALQFAVERVGEPHVYDVLRLTALTTGLVPLAAPGATPQRAPAPDLAWSARRAWGPDDAGVDHPFPLSAAFTYAREDPSAPALREFLAAHPGAYTEAAEYREERPQKHTVQFEVERKWWFSVTDGHERLAVGVVQVALALPGEDAIAGLGVLPAPPVTTGYRYDNDTVGEHGIDPRSTPVPPVAIAAELPTVRSLLDRWRAFTDGQTLVQSTPGWGFAPDCPASGGCVAGALRFRAGARVLDGDGELVGLPRLGRVSGQVLESLLTLDERGRNLRLDEVEYNNPSALGNALVIKERTDATRPMRLLSTTDAVTVWGTFTGRTALATGALAVLVGLAVWLWPLAKHLAGLAFYTRLDRPGALHHPARAQLAALIDANPGIHFQEVLRRLGWSVGTTRHHLQKLLQLGVVSQQAGARYTCYFTKGKVDRRLMAAQPVLKSRGAKEVLAAVTNHPGASAAQIAVDSRLSATSVFFHLKRLQATELIQVEKEGKELRLLPTDLGRAALSDSVNGLAHASNGVADPAAG